MRKLIAILGAVGLTATTSATLVACTKESKSTDAVDDLKSKINGKEIEILQKPGTGPYNLKKDEVINDTHLVAQALAKVVTDYKKLAKDISVKVKEAFVVTPVEKNVKELKLVLTKGKKVADVTIKVKLKIVSEEVVDAQKQVDNLKSLIENSLITLTIAKEDTKYELAKDEVIKPDHVIATELTKAVTNYPTLSAGVEVKVTEKFEVSTTDKEGKELALILTKDGKTATTKIKVKVQQETADPVEDAAEKALKSFKGAIDGKEISIQLTKGQIKYEIKQDEVINDAHLVAQALAKAVTDYSSLSAGVEVKVKEDFALAHDVATGKDLKLVLSKDGKTEDATIKVKVVPFVEPVEPPKEQTTGEEAKDEVKQPVENVKDDKNNESQDQNPKGEISEGDQSGSEGNEADATQ